MSLSSIHKAEHEALEALKDEMKDHDQLASEMYDLIGWTVALVPERPIAQVPLAERVCLTLMSRISDDLRCASNLARVGYSLQALTMASSIYEGAFTIAYVGNSEEIASAWRDHEDPIQPFRSVRDLTMGGLRTLGLESPELEAQVEIEYRVYRQLCWAKHLNPVLQSRFGHHLDEEMSSVIFTNGPDLSDEGVRACWFALQHSVASVGRALISLTVLHIPGERQESVISLAGDLGHRSKELEHRAKERWGTEDPFPGKW